MARCSIPQETQKPNIEVRRSKKEQDNASFGGFLVVIMAQDTLSMDNLIEVKLGFVKNGIPGSNPCIGKYSKIGQDL